ncbi:MAG: hypothetical protein KGO02_16075 [Alphaproteobacteria bacterium]|nr:hypothetical protein [Alphaproteobacteria bacterium]
MKKIILAAVSALALSAAFGPAMADGSTVATSSTLTNTSSFTKIAVVSKNDLDAHFGGTSISFAAAAAAGNGGNGGNGGGLAASAGGNGGNAGSGGAAAGSMNNGSISQNSNAFQNFAGINTMTQTTASYNNNQAATSVAAYSPVGFGTGTATVN